MLDEDLAHLYGVETGALNRAVSRNVERFPADFAFRLSEDEWDSLRCQIGISNEGRGGRRHRPRVFTQEGVAMLSGMLRSPQAVAVNVEIMRAFVRLRRVLASHEELARQVAELRRETGERFQDHEERFRAVFQVLEHLVSGPTGARRRIGFRSQSNDDE